MGLKSSLSKGLFSEGRYFISLTNEERRYLALDALNPAWEHQSFFSRTNYVQKHTVLFFNGNMIVKVIYEEYKTVDNVVLWKVYREYDTSLSTEDRKLLLPLTSRGRKKPVIPANVLAIQPLGCELYIHLEENHSSIGAGNLRNCQMLAIGEREKVRNIMSDDDFHAFMRYYIATCPNSYFERIAEIRSMKHQTVKFRVGDIFRCQTDREHYTYGIILGKTREIEKWSELPAQHSFRHLLTQPIIVRMYDAVMTDANMTAEQLSKIPLRPSKLCSDADIIWGTHKIVAHKELEPDDIQFQLHLSRQTTKNEHNTPFTSEILKGMPNDVVRNVREPISLYVEWGFVSFEIPWTDVPDRLRQMLDDGMYYDGGVSMGISGVFCGRTLADILSEAPKHMIQYNLLLPENRDKFNLVMNSLGMPDDCTYDEFAEKFGALSRDEYIQLIRARTR